MSALVYQSGIYKIELSSGTLKTLTMNGIQQRTVTEIIKNSVNRIVNGGESGCPLFKNGLLMFTSVKNHTILVANVLPAKIVN